MHPTDSTAHDRAQAGMDEMFFSYPRADRAAVLPLVKALRDAGVRVFLDESGIDEFDGITDEIRSALAGARLFVAYYSATYPTRPACQWELLTVFRAAVALGRASERILVINPEPVAEHIQPVQLRDARYGVTTEPESVTRLVERIVARVAGSPGCLGDAIASKRPVWRPLEHLGSERFVGRVDEFWQLHQALHAFEYLATQDGASAGQAVVMGLGGVGKTLLVEQYARRFAAFYPGGIYWFTSAASHTPDAPASDAGQADVLAQHYQQVAAALALDSAALDPAQVREAARQRIETVGEPCLWIVDDVPGELSPGVVRELAAPHPLGRTVMTTRWRGYQLPVVDVDVLHPDEAYRLLTTARIPNDPAEQTAARTLVQRLGSHALAVDLARGCLADQPGLTFTELLDQLADTQHGDAFQELVKDLYMQVPTDHTNDIAATFARSLHQLDDHALTLLRIAALLAPAPLPERLLTSISTALNHQDEPNIQRADRRALSAAQRRSLIRQTGTQPPSWFMHALVSRTLTLNPETTRLRPTLRQAALAATMRLMQAVYTPGRLDLADVMPHARALVEELDTSESLDLLDSVARYDYESGQPASASHHYQRLTDARTTRLSDDHPDTLTTRSNLANAYRAAGDLGRAIPLLKETLTDSVRVLGEDHPNTLTTRNNLAVAYRAAGDLGRAIPLYKQTLTDRVRVLGEDHPNTLTTRNNLAVAYRAAGDLGRAIPLFEQTLTDRVRVLGEDHPNTLTTRNNLAVAYRAAGDLGRAIPLYEQTLTDIQRVLGEDHPDTLTSRNNLAVAYRAAGDLGRAIPLYEQTLTDSVRVLGEDHPNTLGSRNNLAGAYQSAGDLGRAIPLFEETLTDSVRVLGEDHPNTLGSRNNLAGAYQSAGDLGRAIPLFEETLTDRVRVLGEDHPDTLGSRNNLAGAYYVAGDLGRAIPLYKQTLTDRVRVLGEDHPDTLGSRNNLAGAYQSAGDLGRAIPLYKQTLTDRVRVLGEDHPNTLTSRNNLAGAYQSAGDLGRAIPLFEQTLTDRVRVLGEDHPNTLTSRNNLASARQKAEAVQHGSTATSATEAVPQKPSTAD
ncbi:FxSxx-COOH system tetratricopeptide repeat protein [Streptomyces sp. NBC_00151]|uniref:FxSxx-COOH system tetratricopeptide repeat protein n=1 Tax=Streptomyces sp. NBC_00151 TaxID=2975669 RepID=UPI002DDC4F29|nr:FxSxx-COOH system tetratricopeptide repeat protein [Streptomyces sp. NBC_00151]WRZ41703.1 FxSxx-COOH system tetratricopeptide repeat protein [Streptomyces sp. NBC_00151]